MNGNARGPTPRKLSRQLRVAFIAASGAGKSSAARFLREAFASRGLTSATIKLAAPLYRVQSAIYAECGAPQLPDGFQDRPLMELVAEQMRRISPHALLAPFIQAVQHCEADVVINDDLRDPLVDWPALVKLGFETVSVVSTTSSRHQRLARRGDPASRVESKADRGALEIQTDYSIENVGDLSDLSLKVERLAQMLLSHE